MTTPISHAGSSQRSQRGGRLFARITALTDADESTATRLRHVSSATADSADPTASTHPNEPTDPIEQADPTLPMESTEFRDPIDTTDPLDHSDSTDPATPAPLVGELDTPCCAQREGGPARIILPGDAAAAPGP